MPRNQMLFRLSKSARISLALLLVIISLFSLGARGGTAEAGATPPTGSVVYRAPLSNVGDTSPNGLVINEIFYSQTVADQYFELYNTGSAAINLSTYRIYNRDGFNDLSRLGANTMINAGEFRVIGPTQLGTPTIAGSGLARLDFLGLVNTSPTDTVIDVVNFGGAPNPNWPNYETNGFNRYFFTTSIPQLPVESTSNTKSLQRWPDGLDTDRGTDFAQILSSPSSASCGDPYEDDNTAATATVQGTGAPVLHRLCPAGDQDWIAISMSTSVTYTLQTTPQGALVDTVLRLYDASNNLIVEDDNSTSRGSVINFRPTSAGTFRVQITDKNNAGNNGPDFLYTFAVTTTSANTPTPTTPTPAGCLDIYEPDDSLATAKPIELNSQQDHSLCPTGDQDWVSFPASPGKVYTMATSDLGRPVDTIIALYDARGTKLAENDDYAPGQGLQSRIDYTFANGNTYYLRIRDKRGIGGTGYVYTVSVSTEGALPPTGTATRTPTVNPNATATSGPCYDLFEPDGVPETARTILIGSTQRHSICPAVDADWVRFYARAGKVYTIRTTNLGVGLDTYMYLFDSDGKRILAQNDDGGEGVASRIDFYPQRDDWYFVQVKNAGDIGGSDQTYELGLVVVPGAPQAPSTATAGGGPLPQPTTVVQATKPPAATPTQGKVAPTPPGPIGTTVSQPLPTRAVSTAVIPAPQPTSRSVDPTKEPTIALPGVPVTGAKSFDDEKPPVKSVANGSPQSKTGQQAHIAAPNPAPNVSPLIFRIFYDLNHNDGFDTGEGIRGLDIYFLSPDANLGVSGTTITGPQGSGKLTLPLTQHRVFIPYLGINVPLTDFPGREMHSLWLPPVALPDRVP